MAALLATGDPECTSVEELSEGKSSTCNGIGIGIGI